MLYQVGQGFIQRFTMSRILEKIFKIAEQSPQKIALFGEGKNGQNLSSTEEISYQDLANRIKTVSDSLQNLNHNKIALIADNSPSWIIFDLACLYSRITLIPLPQFFTEEQINNALNLEGVEALFTDDQSIATKIPKLQEGHFTAAGIGFFYYKISSNRSAKSDIAKITFTSGSTGNPKGIALLTKQIDTTTFTLFERIGEENFSKNLSVFPLAILLENIAGAYLQLISQSIAVIPSLAKVGITNSSGINVEAFSRAIMSYNPTSLITSPELAKILIFLAKAEKISAKNFRFIAVGGARIAAGLVDEAHKLGIPLYQGYGLSESCSVVSLNSKRSNKNGSVGKILPHLQVKISDEGEILVKGISLAENLSVDSEEYYKTGDLGYFDEEGFLFISGRKKNIFITSMMRNVSPEWVESEILKSPLISQAAVFGESMLHGTAIVIATDPRAPIEVIKLEIDKANQNLPDYAQVKNFILASEPFSVKNQMLTGTGRIRREEVWKSYKSKINQHDIF